MGLPEYGIHVAGSITTPDGGEDGRILWTKGPRRTSFLPSRFSQFQVKAGQVAPTAAAREVVSPKGEVKPMVRSALEAGGHYNSCSVLTPTPISRLTLGRIAFVRRFARPGWTLMMTRWTSVMPVRLLLGSIGTLLSPPG